jgi:multiple sugar transport system permease protein
MSETVNTRKKHLRKAMRVGIAALRTIVVAGICYIILLPILTKLSSSFMFETDLYDQTVRWIPRHFTLDNYKLVWQYMRYPEAFVHSLLLSLVVAVLQLAACTSIGYGLGRFHFRGVNLLFSIVVFMMIVPPQTIMIPLYLNFRYFDLFGVLPDPGLNLIGTHWPFVLLSVTGTGLRNGLFIYIMRQFFKGMPKELEEAAYVDGAGPYVTFYRVMLPSAGPALVIVFLFAFVWQWNDSYLTGMFLGGKTVLPVMLESLLFNLGPGGGGYALQITGQYASLINNTGMLLFMAPLLLLYTVMQRYFVESVERSGIVG